MFKKLYLPVGMLVMLALSLVYPAAGSWIKPLHLNNVFIILIFLVCGWQTNMNGLKFDRKFFFLFIAGAVASLAIAPWLAKGIGSIMNLGALPVAGLVVISAMPPTLSSGIVMTENAEGNTFLAMTLTIGYNLLGVFTIPVILSWILASSGSVHTDPVNMLIKLFLLVVPGWIVLFLCYLFFLLFTPKVYEGTAHTHSGISHLFFNS